MKYKACISNHISGHRTELCQTPLKLLHLSISNTTLSLLSKLASTLTFRVTNSLHFFTVLCIRACPDIHPETLNFILPILFPFFSTYKSGSYYPFHFCTNYLSKNLSYSSGKGVLQSGICWLYAYGTVQHVPLSSIFSANHKPKLLIIFGLIPFAGHTIDGVICILPRSFWRTLLSCRLFLEW